jgi:LysM repeat protein
MYSRMFFKYAVFFLTVLFITGCDKAKGPITSMDDLQKRVNSMTKLTQDVEQRRTELYGLIRVYNNQQEESKRFDIASVDTTIGAPEKELLQSMFRDEKDISFNGILKTIVQKNSEIAELNRQISEMKDQLPVPYEVRKNDTHYKIVIDYLVNYHRMKASEAKKVAYTTALIDDLLPGNQVWLMYNDGIVGTYVTQGGAKMAPLKFQRLAKKRLIEKSRLLSSDQRVSEMTAGSN